VFLRLLARSGTGQPITAYTSHFNGPLRGGEMHVVILDNGRSRILGQQAFRRSLSCIRCGACMNTCPVYQRSGGYTRVVKLGWRRGDGAETAKLELVGSELVKRAAERAARREERLKQAREGTEGETGDEKK